MRVVGVTPNRATSAHCSGDAMMLDAKKKRKKKKSHLSFLLCGTQRFRDAACATRVCAVCMTNMHMQNNLKGVQVGGVRGWGVVA